MTLDINELKRECEKLIESCIDFQDVDRWRDAAILGRDTLRDALPEIIAAIEDRDRLKDAAMLALQELTFMLNHAPDRRGGKYEQARDALRVALKGESLQTRNKHLLEGK